MLLIQPICCKIGEKKESGDCYKYIREMLAFAAIAFLVESYKTEMISLKNERCYYV